jgi:hypothetical protein
MNKKIIAYQVKNGLTTDIINGILRNLNLLVELHLVESDTPDIVFFGPYGDDIPCVGDYLIVGLFPECIVPPMKLCDFALGVVSESLVKNKNYIRFQFWGDNPDILKKGEPTSVAEKKYFCSFFYSHKIKYRELFFKELHKYKKVNAPGGSMNNYPNVDSPEIPWYQSKQNFLAQHKFNVAFENYIQPGYLTEKLYGALYAGTVPIYFGDPNIAVSFLNPDCFINARDFIIPKSKFSVELLDHLFVEDFNDYRPAFRKTLDDKIKRKIKAFGRDYKMKLITNNFDFTPLVNYIREVDTDDDLYNSYLSASWCEEAKLEFELSKQKTFWRNIFSKV